MPEVLQNMINQFRERWELLSFNQRILVGTLVLGLVFSSTFFFRQANDNYTILYSNLSLPDASAIVNKLKEDKTSFRLADGGTTILVPEGKKNELTLSTANELTGDQVITLDKIPPVVQGDVQKEWIKKMNTQAITGVLESMRGIKSAQVIVSNPEQNIFIDSDEPTTASVMLTVDTGFRIREEQVKTIRNLVSHAVPGLLPHNVVIADNSGNPLEGPGGIIHNGLSDSDVRQKNFEDKVSKKVMQILTPVVGKGNAVVSVSALLNFDQAEAQIHRIIPTGGSGDTPTGVAESTQIEQESYSDGVKPEGGLVGVESNVPDLTYPGQTNGADKKSAYSRSKQTTNFKNSEETKKVIYAPGSVERMTVAVVLNKVLTEKEGQQIRDLVASAAGVDMSRGDAIDIKGFKFSDIPADKQQELVDAAKSAEQQAFYLQIGSLLAVVILGLASILTFYLMFKKPIEGELIEEDMEDYELFEETDTLIEETPIPIIEARLDPEIEHMRESLNHMIEEDPSEAARVLVTYMKEM